MADALQRLTPEAKQVLSATIRSLRERLLRDLGDEAERRYWMSVSIAQAGLAEAPRRRRERLEAWLDERARTIEVAEYLTWWRRQQAWEDARDATGDKPAWEV